MNAPWRHLAKPGDVHGIAEDVDRDHDRRPIRDAGSHRLGIQVVRIERHVGEDGPSARVHHGSGRGNEREGREYHFPLLRRPLLENGAQYEEERVRAGVDGDGMPDADVLRELRLQPLHVRTLHVGVAAKDLEDETLGLGAPLRVDPAGIHEGDAEGGGGLGGLLGGAREGGVGHRRILRRPTSRRLHKSPLKGGGAPRSLSDAEGHRLPPLGQRVLGRLQDPDDAGSVRSGRPGGLPGPDAADEGLDLSGQGLAGGDPLRPAHAGAGHVRLGPGRRSPLVVQDAGGSWDPCRRRRPCTGSPRHSSAGPSGRPATTGGRAR